MKVISKKDLTKATLLGKVRLQKKPEKKTGHVLPIEQKKPEKTTGHDFASDQVTILKQLKVTIDTWLSELDIGAKSIQEGLSNVDQSIKAIEIPVQPKPISNLSIYDIERDISGNMTGFQIKTNRGE